MFRDPRRPGGSCSWSDLRCACCSAASGIRWVTFSIRIRVTWICIPSTTGDDAAGTTVSLCCSGAPARPQQAGDVRCGQAHRAHHAAVVDLHGLGADHRQRHARRAARGCPRDAAAGALSVIGSWASASSTVDAVVHTSLAVLAVQRDLQRAAAAQHDRFGLVHRLIGGRVEIVAVADVEAVLLDDVDDARLHRRRRSCARRRRSASRSCARPPRTRRRRSTPATSRRPAAAACGERDSWSLFKAFKQCVYPDYRTRGCASVAPRY